MNAEQGNYLKAYPYRNKILLGSFVYFMSFMVNIIMFQP